MTKNGLNDVQNKTIQNIGTFIIDLEKLPHGSQSLLRSIPKMRVLQISLILLSHLPSKPLSLLFAKTTLNSLLFPPLVLPHIVQSPHNDKNEL